LVTANCATRCTAFVVGGWIKKEYGSKLADLKQDKHSGILRLIGRAYLPKKSQNNKGSREGGKLFSCEDDGDETKAMRKEGNETPPGCTRYLLARYTRAMLDSKR